MRNIIRMSLVAGALVSSVAAQAQTAWTDKVTMGGDLRFRLNSIDDESAGSTDSKYMSNQIRGRLSLSGKVNEVMTANFRLATEQNGGGTSSTSGNHNLGVANGDSAVVFELAYGDWRVMPGLVVSLGKAPNPFWSAGKNEMVFDADLPFDGATAKWTADMDTLKPFVNLSYGQTDDTDGAGVAGANPAFFGAQVGTSLGLGDTMNATVSVAQYVFTNTGATAPAKNPKLLDISLEVGLNMVANLPLSIYADHVQNQEGQVAKEEKGTIVGVKAGQFAAVGSWEAWYNYRDVGGEAIVAGIQDSEFAGGSTTDSSALGHQVGAGYMAWDNTTVGLNYMMAKRGAAETDYNRIIADLIWKF